MTGERASVEWCAVITSDVGEVESLAGVSLLRFDTDGHVVEQRDVWAAVPGPTVPSHWAR